MRRHRGSRSLVVAVVALVIVGVIGGGVAWWLSHRGPTRPSIGGAVGRFRSSSKSTGTAGARRPDAGVYVYEGNGDEHLSFMATSQSQAGSLPGTVTPAPGGCWTFAIEYNSFHKQTWTWCAPDGRLVERGNTTDQKFDFGPLSQSEHTEVVCNPPTTFYDPASKPGHETPVRCTGRSETTKANMVQRGRVRFVGRTTVLVGNTRVAAVHIAQNLTISGDQSGSQHEDLWIARRNGLPLREERTVRVRSPAPSPLNEVTYTERGSWQLTSLTPRR